MCEKVVIIPSGTIFYHGTTLHLKDNDIFSSFDEQEETYITKNEKAAEFFSGDLADPTGDPIVIKLITKREIALLETKYFSSDNSSAYSLW